MDYDSIFVKIVLTIVAEIVLMINVVHDYIF